MQKSEVAPIDQLPSATHTGANTFGCLIDGEAFYVSGKSYLGNETGISFHPSLNRAWWINGKQGDLDISMNFDYNNSPFTPGTYEMADNYPAGAEYLNPTSGSTAITGGNDFKTDSVNKETLTLQFYNGKTAAGIFSFDVQMMPGK